MAHKHNPIDREAVRRLWWDRLTDTAIAARLGCCRNTVYKVRKELGLHLQSKRATKTLALQSKRATKTLAGWCVGCHEDAARASVAGPVCDRCGKWVDEQQERIAWLLP